ncbi:hypothetical protein GN958_ATG02772 [Phytophthora infestans]|uniref:Uncharacterized protein n=1 Tax=Phytophthora infestans TaxID=4787 RepID=A0A8S9VBZ1_PHYIN|nr:hypothetical protein GN958_ATG02772 [Phytophthora infestans]
MASQNTKVVGRVDNDAMDRRHLKREKFKLPSISSSATDGTAILHPIGFGSRRSVLLAALNSRDPGGSGFITCKQLVEGLQTPNFGLDERLARALVTEFDDQMMLRCLIEASLSTFNYLKNGPAKLDKIQQFFYQDSYVNRVRTHAAQLIEKVAVVPLEPASQSTEVPVVLANIAQSRGKTVEQCNGAYLVARSDASYLG